MIYLLDSDACVEVLRHGEPMVSRVLLVSPHDIGISAMTESELEYGVFKSRAAERERRHINDLLRNLGYVLPFDSAAARVHARLRHAIRAQPIGPHDLIIASIAIANDLTLVTHNTREFSRVPGLAIEDWMMPPASRPR